MPEKNEQPNPSHDVRLLTQRVMLKGLSRRMIFLVTTGGRIQRKPANDNIPQHFGVMVENVPLRTQGGC
jgi:hypothetical protein